MIQYLKNNFADSIQIWHVDVTGSHGVSFLKLTLNAHVYKNYIEFKFFMLVQSILKMASQM